MSRPVIARVAAGSFLLAAALGGCLPATGEGDPASGGGQGEGDGTAVATGAVGEPMGDYPSYDERVALYATNRARVDPAAEGWASFAAQPPLLWHHDLNRFAEHSRHWYPRQERVPYTLEGLSVDAAAPIPEPPPATMTT